MVTYHDINLNKKSEWVGNQVTVERCISDVVLVDNALNESMLNPKLQIENIQISSDSQSKGNCKVKTDKAQELQEIINEEDDNRKRSIDDEDKSKAIITDGNLDQTINHGEKDETNGVQLEEDVIEDKSKDDIMNLKMDIQLQLERRNG